MRAFGTVVAILAALVWSGAVWGGYQLLAVAAETLALGADPGWLPPEVWSLSNLVVDLIDHYGSGLAAGIWAVGILAILAIRAVYNWILTQAARPTSTARPAEPLSAPVELPREPAPAPTPTPQVRWGRNGAA